MERDLSEVMVGSEDKGDIRRLKIILYVEILLFVLVFSYLSILRHNRINSAMYDLGLFDQLIYNLAHGRFFESSIKGFNYLGDHFSPILIIFAPLYWIWEDVRILLIAQAFIVSLSGYFAGMLAYQITKNIRLSSAFALSILGNANVMLIVLFDFHPETLTIPIFMFILLKFHQEDNIGVFIASIFALLIKEDVSITIALMGLVFAIIKRDPKYLMLSALGSIYFVLAIKVFIPYFRPSIYKGDYLYLERYSYLGGSIKEVIRSIISNPLYPVIKMYRWSKLKVLLRLFYPTLFLSFLSPVYLIVILPILYINWIANYGPQFSLKYQYLNVVIPFIIGSSIYGYLRLNKLLKDIRMEIVKKNLDSIVSLAMILFVIGNIIILYNTTTAYNYFRKNYYESSFYEVKKMIPEKASLATINTFGPHFTHRERIEFAVPFNLHLYHYKKLGLNMYSDAEYQLFLTKGDSTSDPEVTRNRIKELIEKYNYSVIFDRDDILLLKKSR